MDAFQRVQETVAQAAGRAQHLRQHCFDVKADVCRNLVSALSSRCRRLRQSSAQRAVAFASVNSPEFKANTADESALRTVEPDGHASGTATKPGKVSGSLWGPRGARATASDQQDSSSQPEAPYDPMTAPLLDAVPHVPRHQAP